jgi:predicted adenylyl cyclase CyaB
MPSNIEVKIRIFDSVRIRSLIVSSGARDEGELHQIDTFFQGSKRLKLREFGENQTAELIAYDRPDIEGLRTSDYRIYTTSNLSGLKETLSFGLKVTHTVEKKRHLYLLRRTRIHLDEVTNLGHFLELEVVLGHNDDVCSGEKEAEEILRLLELQNAARISGSYCDLIQMAKG